MNIEQVSKRVSNSSLGIGRILAAFVLLLVGILSGYPTATAQAVYGSIYGTATDTTGDAIPNATVTVTDVSKGASVTVQSNESGLYRVPILLLR